MCPWRRSSVFILFSLGHLVWMVTGGKRGLRLSRRGLFRVLKRELVDVERMRSDEHNDLLAVRLVSVQLRNRKRKTVVRQLNKKINKGTENKLFKTTLWVLGPNPLISFQEKTSS